ncbi:MAG: hypothetical protein KA157_05505 [Aliarcobacter sp.]|nr:hypothetical protein [Aliarcobacter sp.]
MNNFNSKLSQLYKQISHELSNEFDIVLSPKNPYIIENANILISSYKKITLILFLTKKEINDFEYLLYKIYLLRLAYPVEANIIIYTEKDTNINYIDNLESMKQVNFLNSKSELLKFIKFNNNFTLLDDDLRQNLIRVKNENFYRSNLIFLSTYQKNKNLTDSIQYEQLLNQYKKDDLFYLKNRRIKKFNTFIKESLIAVETLKSKENYLHNLKTLSFYSFLNNFNLDNDYIGFTDNELPNCLLYDNLAQNDNELYIYNSLSFSNLYLSKLNNNDDNFYNTYYKFGQRYNEKLFKFRNYNENKNKKY